MSNQTGSNETQTGASQAATPTEPSFSEYVALRREGKSVISPPEQSAPTAEKQPEHKKSPESDTEETEAKESKDATVDHDSEEETESADESEKDDKPSKKGKGGFQRRIDKLNARIADKDREAQYWRDLALKNGKEAPAIEKSAEKVAALKETDSTKPDPGSFDTHAEYVEALTDWKIDQKEKAKAVDQQKSKLLSERDALLKAHQERLKSFADKVADFGESIDNLDDVPVSAEFQEIILSSENGPALLYELAKNKDEALRISKLPTIAAARELGKIEAKIVAAQAAAETKSEPKKTTSAPKPLDPVGKSTGAVAKSITDPEIPFSEYERIRREQIKRRRA